MYKELGDGIKSFLSLVFWTILITTPPCNLENCRYYYLYL